MQMPLRISLKNQKYIGAFLVEPIMGNCCSITANQQYMEDVRYLCRKVRGSMIIDEVKTVLGCERGAQELYNIEVDLCTFAKAIGNGYPVAVLAGKENYAKYWRNDGVVHADIHRSFGFFISSSKNS